MLKYNLQKILKEIENGNNLGEQITLVGATKTMDAETINKAVELGLKVVAENRVQEFIQKTEFIKNAQQQFIGHLQTNKVKYLVGKVSLIQSVDSVKLALAIDERAKKLNLCQDVLIEINAGAEESKGGFSLNQTLEVVKELSSLSNIKIKGLMAMMPKTSDTAVLIELFDKIRKQYDLLKEYGYDMQYLSMGMSGDYILAIQHGSNMIRLGRNIFGERK